MKNYLFLAYNGELNLNIRGQLLTGEIFKFTLFITINTAYDMSWQVLSYWLEIHYILNEIMKRLWDCNLLTTFQKSHKQKIRMVEQKRWSDWKLARLVAWDCSFYWTYIYNRFYYNATEETSTTGRASLIILLIRPSSFSWFIEQLMSEQN